jgi:hypothetical protein
MSFCCTLQFETKFHAHSSFTITAFHLCNKEAKHRYTKTVFTTERANWSRWNLSGYWRTATRSRDCPQFRYIQYLERCGLIHRIFWANLVTSVMPLLIVQCVFIVVHCFLTQSYESVRLNGHVTFLMMHCQINQQLSDFLINGATFRRVSMNMLKRD